MREPAPTLPPNPKRSGGTAPDASGRCRVESLGPELLEEWDRYVYAHKDATLFHTIAWRDSVGEAFGHEHLYVVARRESRIVGVLPLFYVSSLLGGRMLVSVPYGVGGGILADDDGVAEALFTAARRIADERRCNKIDLRSERAAVEGIPVVDRHVGFSRELPRAVEDLAGWLPRKARAAARNARDKHGLEVSFGDEHLREAWRLYSMNMRRLGSLSYPRRFLERLITYTPGGHWVCIAGRDGRAVGGLVTFMFKDSVMPYFVGTSAEARRYGTANLLYLSVMERGVECGYRVFDFGRTRRDNTGGMDFKRFHGFAPRPLEYQCYAVPGSRSADLSPSNPRFRAVRKAWTYLPLWVTQIVGARLARHVPG